MMRMVKHWNRKPREIVSSFLELFKVRLAGILSNLI